MKVPVFPLNSVVLPGGRIPLQLFEPRYIDMLTRCMKGDQGFVITLLRDGAETGRVASFYETGTYVRRTFQATSGTLGSLSWLERSSA
jgi:Lon protease-like protein